MKNMFMIRATHHFHWNIISHQLTHQENDSYPLVNKLVDPENHQCLMETLVFQPRQLPGSMLIYQRVFQWDLMGFVVV